MMRTNQMLAFGDQYNIIVVMKDKNLAERRIKNGGITRNDKRRIQDNNRNGKDDC